MIYVSSEERKKGMFIRVGGCVRYKMERDEAMQFIP